jgi:hypothetical protein
MIAGDEKSECAEGNGVCASVLFVSWRPFHGENTGSIPVGRANKIKHLAASGGLPSFFWEEFGAKWLLPCTRGSACSSSPLDAQADFAVAALRPLSQPDFHQRAVAEGRCRGQVERPCP